MFQKPDSPFIKYIANKLHYDDVIGHIGSVKKTLWIGAEWEYASFLHENKLRRYLSQFTVIFKWNGTH